MVPRTYKWMREHVQYDDVHPIIALEVVKKYAASEKMQKRVMLAAKRSVQLLHNALMTSYKAYSVKADVAGSETRAHRNARRSDRRVVSVVTGFPERRFGERRGRAWQVCA